MLDIGCGGGLLCEPMTRMGAQVTGVDPAERTIKAAQTHAKELGLQVDYRVSRAEELVEAGELFDIVVNMEVIEHVPDVPAFLKTCSTLVHPGGLMLASTLNRTVKSYGLAIIGAEYIMRWLPTGTHQWQRFVTPDELKKALLDAGLLEVEQTGMSYNPLSRVAGRLEPTLRSTIWPAQKNRPEHHIAARCQQPLTRLFPCLNEGGSSMVAAY